MSWFSNVFKSIEHAVSNVGKAFEHAVGDAAKAVANAVRTGGKVLGKVVQVLGAPVQIVVDGIVHEIGNLTGIHVRSLTQAERNVLLSVFGNSLPVDKILLTTISGKNGRGFTIPGSMIPALSGIIPGIGPLIALGSLIEHLQDKYLINVGKTQYMAMLPSNYDIGFQERSGSLLVHEATHVWQGVHSAFPWWYVFNSLYYQLECGQHAYDVDESRLQTWSNYHVEQQAHLVENWYSRGSNPSDVNYPFIRDNIRPGKPGAQTALSTNVISVFDLRQRAVIRHR
jgi:hypothetical protein